jgi:hypothetical protein
MAARNRRRESDPTPFCRCPGGDPAAHPTPNTQRPHTQRPNTQRSAAASPRVHIPQLRLYRGEALDWGFQMRYRDPRRVTSSSTCPPGGDPAAHPTPNTQRPTPNTQRPNTQRSAAARPRAHIPQRRLYRLEVLDCAFQIRYRGLRKVTSSTCPPGGDPAAHPTPNTQRPKSGLCTQHPTPRRSNAQRQSPKPSGSRPRSSVRVMRPIKRRS